VKILLDTHIALWAFTAPGKLPNEVVTELCSAENRVYYSMASVWEIAIKHRLKPEEVPMPEETFVEMCKEAGLCQLPISAEHIYMIKTLVRSEGAPRHNDPFDRLMISQAKAEGMIFVTHDSLIPYYNEKCVMYV
jgi:PIN domain nuclease of toxin-antitoxin system